jgi:hypothetical protein
LSVVAYEVKLIVLFLVIDVRLFPGEGNYVNSHLDLVVTKALVVSIFKPSEANYSNPIALVLAID